MRPDSRFSEVARRHGIRFEFAHSGLPYLRHVADLVVKGAKPFEEFDKRIKQLLKN
jgi:hypothetical protein